MDVTSQAQDLETLFTQVKNMLPKNNTVDWGYFTQMTYGLQAAGNDQQKLNIITHFANKFSTDVVPLLSAQASTDPPEPASHDVPPPRGGGFMPISWNARLINGNYFHPPNKVVIRG